MTFASHYVSGEVFAKGPQFDPGWSHSFFFFGRPHPVKWFKPSKTGVAGSPEIFGLGCWALLLLVGRARIAAAWWQSGQQKRQPTPLHPSHKHLHSPLPHTPHPNPACRATTPLAPAGAASQSWRRRPQAWPTSRLLRRWLRASRGRAAAAPAAAGRRVCWWGRAAASSSRWQAAWRPRRGAPAAAWPGMVGGEEGRTRDCLLSVHPAILPLPLRQYPAAPRHQSHPQRLPRRWVLERAGPLPQYHPAALAALLLAGRPGAAAAVLGALLAWVRALRQHDAAQCAQQEGGTPLRAAGPSAAPKYQSELVLCCAVCAVRRLRWGPRCLHACLQLNNCNNHMSKPP